MDIKIQCYKCGKDLGVIRDALLYKDMYYVCGFCINGKQTKTSTSFEDFFGDMLNGKRKDR